MQAGSVKPLAPASMHTRGGKNLSEDTLGRSMRPKTETATMPRGAQRMMENSAVTRMSSPQTTKSCALPSSCAPQEGQALKEGYAAPSGAAYTASHACDILRRQSAVLPWDATALVKVWWIRRDSSKEA